MLVTPALGRQENQTEPRLCLNLAGDVTQLEESLPSMKAWVPSPALHRLGCDDTCLSSQHSGSRNRKIRR